MSRQPYYADDWLTVYQGDCREVMASMEPESVHCVVTSPPYWGLRDYGTATWVGGDPDCSHRIAATGSTQNKGNNNREGTPFRERCGRCGAVREDAQLGLEPTPEEYVENMVAVFREVRRVLRSDGTVWLNLGDSYAGSGPSGAAYQSETTRRRAEGDGTDGAFRVSKRLAERGLTYAEKKPVPPPGLKPKDLVGIPWRVAFALQQPYYAGRIADERDRTWLAALMDGEGTFTILATTGQSGAFSYPPIAQVRMTSELVVRKAASLVGVASPAQYPPSGTGRAVYQWRQSGRRAADIARELYPYLLEKRRQALIAWNHQEVRDGYETKRGVSMPSEARAKQLVCRDLIRRLNHGEHVDIPTWMSEPPSLTEPGWYLRSDVIWSKPNPMPESVTDRPTKAHEYLFLLSKAPRYYYDADAVREPHTTPDGMGWAANGKGERYSTSDYGTHRGAADFTRQGEGLQAMGGNPLGRNLRSVWTVATQPYPGAHFATFPEKLVEPCLKAGCPTLGTVLDPFAGSGTTGRVAQRLSRRAVLIDLNADYLVQAMNRNRDIPLGLEAS